jgi:hypothetical protein
LPDGRVIDPCGLAAALASLSARQVKALGLRTSGIYGPPGSTSSRSVGLQSSLESRLRARLLTTGSTLYTLTWKAWATPSGVSRFRLRASVPRTSATGTIGSESAWPTPTTRDWKDGSYQPNVPLNALLGRVVWLAGWPTPAAQEFEIKDVGRMLERREECKAKGYNGNGFGMTLGMATAMQMHHAKPARYTVSGELLTGSDARMESGGQLNTSQ